MPCIWMNDGKRTGVSKKCHYLSSAIILVGLSTYLCVHFFFSPFIRFTSLALVIKTEKHEYLMWYIIWYVSIKWVLCKLDWLSSYTYMHTVIIIKIEQVRNHLAKYRLEVSFDIKRCRKNWRKSNKGHNQRISINWIAWLGIVCKKYLILMMLANWRTCHFFYCLFCSSFTCVRVCLFMPKQQISSFPKHFVEDFYSIVHIYWKVRNGCMKCHIQIKFAFNYTSLYICACMEYMCAFESVY